ncbi:radical SAM protein [Prevotella koreensis]
MEKNFVSIISVTKSCPLRCKYCYVHSKNEQKISLTTVFRIIDELFNINKCPIHEFIWHGGEPLVMGISFYQSVCDYLAEHYPDKRVVHKLQTSGILITHEWAEFFKTNHFEVGVSLDGPEHIHDRQRFTQLGKPTFQMVCEGVKLLQECGLKPGFIAVITRNSLPYAREIFDFFYTNNWQFSFAKVSCGEGCLEDLSITPKEYARFYGEILDCFLQQQEFRLKIVPIFHHVMSFLKGNSVGLCTNEENCGGSYLSFAPNGEVFNCNRFVDYPEMAFGNILHESLEFILKSSLREMFSKRAQQLSILCGSCKYKTICYGGCPSEQFVRTGSIMGKSAECEINSLIFPMIEDRLKRELSVDIPE